MEIARAGFLSIVLEFTDSKKSDTLNSYFVLPRSFFSADHHDNTRSGKAKGFRLTAAWDLDGVSELFRVPSCTLFAQKSDTPEAITKNGLPGKTFNGKLPTHNSNWSIAVEKLTEENVQWFYLKQGNSSALSTRKPDAKSKPNPYKKEFKQGATIVPRSLYFVDLNQPMPPDFEDRVLNTRTSTAIQQGAKEPWTDIDLKGKIESRFLFCTALAKSILPFTLFNPSLVVLPITIEKTDMGDKKIKLHTSDELRREGFLNASSWFKKAEDLWTERKTEKAKNMTNLNRLDFQKGLSDQNLNAPYLVLYNSSAQDANATIVKRADYNLEFIVDHKAYVFYTHFLNEAYYLSAIFNSTAPNEMMKDFQSRGLFGARDIHKKILDIYFPRFDTRNELHLRLAALSKTAHQKAAEFLRANPPQHELKPAHLGRLRTEINKHIESELKEIDSLVERIIADSTAP